MKKSLFAFIIILLVFQSCDEAEQQSGQSDSLAQKLIQSVGKTDSLNSITTASPGDTSKTSALPPVVEGDIIFSDPKDQRGDLIREITKGKYTHCGMIFVRKRDSQFVVAEVDDSVKVTPLQEWIDSAKGQHVAVYRFKDVNMMMTKKRLDKIKQSLRRYKNLPADPYLSWGDEAMYSTELVWKAYHDGTGYRLAERKAMSTLNLTGPQVSKNLKQKYGSITAVPDSAIMPEDLMNSPLLEKAFER